MKKDIQIKEVPQRVLLVVLDYMKTNGVNPVPRNALHKLGADEDNISQMCAMLLINEVPAKEFDKDGNIGNSGFSYFTFSSTGESFFEGALSNQKSVIYLISRLDHPIYLSHLLGYANVAQIEEMQKNGLLDRQVKHNDPQAEGQEPERKKTEMFFYQLTKKAHSLCV